LICIDEGVVVPGNAEEFSGLVFMGGPMSVNDPLPWVTQELDLIRDAVARSIPVLGHCLGGQLMARAFGAQVRRNAQKEIGWGSAEVADNPAAVEWFGDIRQFRAFHWHGETFDIPVGATRILSTPVCANQAFVLGMHLGLQCHVEMTEAMIADWGRIGAGEIAAHPCDTVQSAEAMQVEARQHLPPLHAVADRLYTRWIGGLRR
jgi:GMP synthase-like glutamine amidotransferase